MRYRHKAKRLLVAAIGVASVSYAGCAAHTEDTPQGNLPSQPGQLGAAPAHEMQDAGSALPPGYEEPLQPTGNLMAPPQPDKPRANDDDAGIYDEDGGI